MPRSRTTRALIASTAGLVGAGAVVCATLAFTHAAHRSPRVASLAPVAATEAPVGRGTTGLLAWQAPPTGAPLSLPPRVIEPVRVVVVTRVVSDSAPTRRATTTTRPARRVATTTQRTRTQTTTASTSRRQSTRTVSARDRDSQREDEDDDRDERRSDRPQSVDGDHERDDDE
jgi:hypothetical protein